MIRLYLILMLSSTTVGGQGGDSYIDNTTYDEFIQSILDTRGRFNCGEEYHERHHIIPKCIGGGNEDNNLIDLFAREHFIAHKLLAKENPSEEKLAHAWTFMCRIKKDNKVFQITPEEYEDAKLNYIKLIKGKPFSEEHRKKIGSANKGKIRTEEMRKRMSITNKREWSKESRQKLSKTISGENHPLFGTHPTEETRRKISQSNKGVQAGSKNPRAMPVVQLDRHDNLISVWKYIKLASIELKVNAADISSCAKGKLKSAGGFHWKYLYDNKSKDGSTAIGAISLGLLTEETALAYLNGEA